MPCETQLKPQQTISERATEVRAVVAKISAALASGKIKPLVSAQGGITFLGLTDQERDGVTDGCIYRRIMATGSATAKLAIARAEQRAGRTINRTAVAQGLHSHDGGVTWHDHKG